MKKRVRNYNGKRTRGVQDLRSARRINRVRRVRAICRSTRSAGLDYKGWKSLNKKEKQLMWRLQNYTGRSTQLIRQYLEKHPRSSYSGALKRVLKESR